MKFFLTLLPLIAFAAPQGLQVVSGSAEIIGSEVRVTESSVLHWDSYHLTLNRVTSDLPSEIYGHLSSNGPLWLINPNGIVIGESGRINAPRDLRSHCEQCVSQCRHYGDARHVRCQCDGDGGSETEITYLI